MSSAGESSSDQDWTKHRTEVKTVSLDVPAEAEILKYTPLKHERAEIRLLEVLPVGSEYQPLSCRLHTVSLDDNPSYIALSYTWGDPLSIHSYPIVTEDGPAQVCLHEVLAAGKLVPELREEVKARDEGSCILVDGAMIFISENLAQALVTVYCTVRRQTRIHVSFYIWIDALCIDQNSHDEKMRQLPLMAQIFGQAKVVFAYLGVGNEQISLAMNTLEACSEFLPPFGEKPKDFGWLRDFPEIWSMDKLLNENENEFWQGMRLLSSFGYWRRVWILQEMALARGHLIFLTSHSAPSGLSMSTLALWYDFATHIEIYNIPELPPFLSANSWLLMALSAERCANSTIRSVRRFILRRIAKLTWKITTMRGFCDTTLRLNASDPKDKIYGLQHLLDWNIDIDYSSNTPLEKVYTDFAVNFIRKGQHSEVLACAGTGKLMADPENFPSWVPVWHHLALSPFNSDAVPQVLNLWDLCYAANADLNLPEWTVSSARSLVAHGCVVDHVHGASIAAEGNPRWLEVVHDFITSPENTDPEYVGTARPLPMLQLLLTTLLRDVPPEYGIHGHAEAKHRLHGSSSLQGQFPNHMHNFLSILCDLDHRAEESERLTNFAKRLKMLGYPTPNAMFEALPQAQNFENSGYRDPDDPTIIRPGLPSGIDWVTFAQVLRKACHPVLNNPIGLAMEQSLASRLTRTIKSSLALVPRRTVEGDLICVISHCRFPVVLRRIGDSYKFVGGAFRFGFMDGEAAKLVTAGEMEIQEFTIT